MMLIITDQTKLTKASFGFQEKCFIKYHIVEANNKAITHLVLSLPE